MFDLGQNLGLGSDSIVLVTSIEERPWPQANTGFSLLEALVAGHVVLENGAAVLEPLGPFGPAAGGVATFPGEDRGTVRRIPLFVECVDLAGGEFEAAVDGGKGLFRGQAEVWFHGRFLF